MHDMRQPAFAPLRRLAVAAKPGRGVGAVAGCAAPARACRYACPVKCSKHPAEPNRADPKRAEPRAC
jgi:hypothetical protein